MHRPTTRQIALAAAIALTAAAIWLYVRRETFQQQQSPDDKRTADYPVYQNKDQALESNPNRTPTIPIELEGKIISTPPETGGDVARGGEISTPDPPGSCDEFAMLLGIC